MATFELTTATAIQAIDVTGLVQEHVDAGSYLLWLSTPHTTAALILCEADAEMLADIEAAAAGLFAPLQPFRHRRNGNPNAAAHLASSVFGTQLLLRVVDGRLAPGRYQRIVFVELDGPKSRTIHLETLPLALPSARAGAAR